MIAIGSDHAGFSLKLEIISYFQKENIMYKDFGTFSEDSVDYPDYARDVSKSVVKGECEIGILVCGTGIGVSIAANKINGIRAALCTDTYMARMAREHNDANILTLGQKVVGPGLAIDIVRSFISGEFTEGRHTQRVGKIMSLEKREE